MPEFVKKTLHKLNFKRVAKKQLAPHKWTVPIYGKNIQFPQPINTSPLLDKVGIKYVQQTVGSLLYYAWAIDNTILPTLNEIALSQAKPTEQTLEKNTILLEYLNTYPNARFIFYASDMQLYVESDVTYLVAKDAKSRISGYYYCSNHCEKSTTWS